MLLSKEIVEVAADLKAEAKGRPYVEVLMPEVVADDSFWRMLIELFEIVLHRRGYVIVKREAVRDLAS
jgi:hypothetical protein